MTRKSKQAFPAGIIGKCAPMRKVYRQIRQAASADIPVLLIGETGTGKDLASQAIHQLSERKEGPYVPVNLGSIPGELVASELFGHEKGSFTGAQSRYIGKFEQSNGGTIFLDEIDSISTKVQVSLLRLLEQRRFHRIGGKRAIRSDARIVAATNSDVDDLLEGDDFRNDLFYRLDVFRIHLPALRHRKGDIALLCEAFIERFNDKLERSVEGLTSAGLAALTAYDWPGNVRELKNIIQRAVLVCQDPSIDLQHLPVRFQQLADLTGGDTPSRISFEIGTPLVEVERKMILSALSAAEGNRTRAAELLGISRRAIYNKLKKHNLE